MQILTLEKKENEEFLRTPREETPLDEEQLQKLRVLAREMRAVMNKAHGVGLSANQVGLEYRFFVAQVPDQNNHPKFYALVNPRITKFSTETRTIEEGCLSIPLMYGKTERPYEVILEAFNLQGKKVKIKAWGLLARVFQHEVGHLDGGLFIDICKNPQKINANDRET